MPSPSSPHRYCYLYDISLATLFINSEWSCPGIVWMHFTVYICGAIVACAWWNGTILTWKFIRMECWTRSAHHFGNRNDTTRRFVRFRIVSYKHNHHNKNGSILILTPFWITLLLLKGIEQFLHQNALEGNAERRRRIIVRIVTYVSLRRFHFERGVWLGARRKKMK